MSNREPSFQPVEFVAHAVGRSHRTIRSWAREGAIRHRRSRDGSGGIEVHVGDAARADRDRDRRPGRIRKVA